MPDPILEAYADISYWDENSPYVMMIPTQECTEGAYLILECKDGRVTIDLHEIAREYGIIEE